MKDMIRWLSYVVSKDIGENGVCTITNQDLLSYINDALTSMKKEKNAYDDEVDKNDKEI